MKILYAVSETDAAVFAERSMAESVGRTRQAISESATWGELRKALDDEAAAELSVMLSDSDIVRTDDETLDADDIPGYADGDYPTWLQQVMLDWFPSDLIDRYGARSNSVLNGEFIDIPGDCAEEVAEELRQRGHTVERTDLPLL